MKTYRMAYRLRIFYCKKCDVHLEIPGEEIKGYVCKTCRKAISSLKKVSDNFFRINKEVVAYADRAQLTSAEDDSIEA